MPNTRLCIYHAAG